MAERLPKHIVDSRDLSRDWIDKLFVRTDRIRDKIKRGDHFTGPHREVWASFYEPSIITQRSFQRGCGYLGWGFSFREVPEKSMWEHSLQAEMSILSDFDYNLFIIRGKDAAMPKLAANLANQKGLTISVISAGGGFSGSNTLEPNQHPTQALTDLYTIHKHFGGLDGLRIVLLGELRDNGVVNSLLFNLAKYNVDLILASKSGSHGIRTEVSDYLANYGKQVKKTEDLHVQLPADVIYVAQPTNSDRPAVYTDLVDQAALTLLPENGLVMHDMLKGVEPQTPDNDPRFVWRLQRRNCVPSRMAMMEMSVAA